MCSSQRTVFESKMLLAILSARFLDLPSALAVRPGGRIFPLDGSGMPLDEEQEDAAARREARHDVVAERAIEFAKVYDFAPGVERQRATIQQLEWGGAVAPAVGRIHGCEP